MVAGSSRRLANLGLLLCLLVHAAAEVGLQGKDLSS